MLTDSSLYRFRLGYDLLVGMWIARAEITRVRDSTMASHP